jgi:hypothetical protein
MTLKVYREGYVEFWLGLKLASDAELMRSFMAVYLDQDAFPGTSDRQTLCTGGLDTISAALKAAYPADWSLQEGFMLWGTWTGTGVVTPPLKFLDTSAPVVGLRGSGGSAPQNTAVLVHKVAPYGRSGRMYLPGVTEGNVSPNGALNGTELGIWQDAIDAAADDLAAYIGTPFFEHCMTGQPAGGGDYTITKPISTYAVDGVVATQRRRLRR